MGTVSKALSLLTHFTRTEPAIGLSDLARRAGMNKATVYRLMTELQAGGLVEQTGDGRAYRLGAEVLRLAAMREAATPFLSVARGILTDLAAETGETAHATLIQGTRLTALDFRYSDRHATRVMMDSETTMGFHATSSGLAVLAYADPALVDQLLTPPLERFTPETDTDPDRIRAQVIQVRATGYAESVGGFEADVHSHAAPIFGPDQRPLGAIAVAAPATRMNDTSRATIRRAVTAAGREMTRRTGGQCPQDYPTATAA